MSVEAIKQIISRAMTEPDFKQMLFSNTAQALDGYDLSESEGTALAALSREEFDAMGGDLEERISRAGLTGFVSKQCSPVVYTCAGCQV